MSTLNDLELLRKLEALEARLAKLEALETPNAILSQPSYPGTEQAGVNANISGSLRAGASLVAGGGILAGTNISAPAGSINAGVNIAATGNLSAGGTITGGNINGSGTITGGNLTTTGVLTVGGNRIGGQGAAFPAGVNGLRWDITGRDLDYFYKASIPRWLSKQIIPIRLLQYGATASPIVLSGSFGQVVKTDMPAFIDLSVASGAEEVYIEGMSVTCSTAATYDATHTWTINIGGISRTNVAGDLLGVQCYDAARGKTAAGQIYSFGARFSGLYSSTTIPVIYATAYNNPGGVGTAGSISLYGITVFIRLVG